VRLYNTLTANKEVYRSRTGRMYVCGITPYDVTHLGHAFTYVFFDVLGRYLEHLGKNVTYVQNVTDIDDDILRKAAQTGEDWKALGDLNSARFWQEFRALGNRMPDIVSIATEHIREMDALSRKLVEGGYAYVSNGSAYFDLSRWPSFGRLSRLDRGDMLHLANERGNHPDDPHKRDPLDLLLWQAAREGEPRWPSSFGTGRPGWHVECSAMALKYLGPTLDIHGGGHDLVFPHHEAEIAQSEAATGKPFARFWMHTGMLRYRGEKMSKSLGNLVYVADLLRESSVNALRLLLLGHHYRESWEYAPRALDDARSLAELLHRGPSGERGARERFFAALDDDMDTPAALEALCAMNAGDAAACGRLLGLEVRDGRIAA